MSAPTIDSSWGSPTANAYADITFANSYFSLSLKETDWTAATTTNQAKALAMAAREIDSKCWTGTRYYGDQALEFPRRIVESFPYGGISPTLSPTGTLSSDFAEQQRHVQRACCEQAAWILANLNDAGVAQHQKLQEMGITNFSDSVPNMSASFTYDGMGASRLCAEAKKELSRYRGDPQIVRGDNLDHRITNR